MNPQVNKIRREKETLIAKSVRPTKAIAVKALSAAIQSLTGPGDAVSALLRELREMENVIRDGLLAAHLYGRYRGIRTAAENLSKTEKTTGAYKSAIDFLRHRMGLASWQLDDLRAKYGQAAVNVTAHMTATVENRAQKAILEIAENGMHVREGVNHLRESMGKVGIAAEKPWLLETMVRSQIEIAYGAGRWNTNQDPAIQEILWGYEYFTVGDDRVRPTHAALDGVRLPKSDSRWNSIWPPNGYCCRCEVIEIFKGDKLATKKDVPDKVDVNGAEVTPGADKGWDVNHGLIYQDMLSPSTIAT